jgi:hypothetical protein
MNPKTAALLLLPTLACAVDPNYTNPEIPMPKAWNEGRAMEATQSAVSLATWWTEFQDASDERRAEMLLPDKGPKKRRRRKKPSAEPTAA